VVWLLCGGSLCRSDVDECALGTHNCDLNYGTCENTDGGFTCICKAGYKNDGVNCAGTFTFIYTMLYAVLYIWTSAINQYISIYRQRWIYA